MEGNFWYIWYRSRWSISSQRSHWGYE